MIHHVWFSVCKTRLCRMIFLFKPNLAMDNRACTQDFFPAVKDPDFRWPGQDDWSFTFSIKARQGWRTVMVKPLVRNHQKPQGSPFGIRSWQVPIRPSFHTRTPLGRRVARDQTSPWSCWSPRWLSWPMKDTKLGPHPSCSLALNLINLSSDLPIHLFM